MRLIDSNSRCHRHERVALVDLEELRRPLLQNSGAERTKWLAVFHTRIDVILHLGVPSVRQYGAVSEGTGPDFGPTLEPADDLACGEISGDPGQEVTLVHALISQPSLLQVVDDFGFTIFRSVESMGQLEAARMPKRLMMMPKRAAERSAGVGRARGHPNRLVVGIAQDAGVGHAVQPHATGHA